MKKAQRERKRTDEGVEEGGGVPGAFRAFRVKPARNTLMLNYELGLYVL